MADCNMWLVVHYFCRENGERRIVSVSEYGSKTEAQCDMISSVEWFKNGTAGKDILHDRESDDRCDIDIRGGYNEWYTWEVVGIL